MIQPDVQFVYADLKIVLRSINDQSMINQNRRRRKKWISWYCTLVMTTGLILLTNSTYIFDR